jgi:hypothetical protein
MVDAVPRLGVPAGHLYRSRSHGLLPPLLDLSVGQACSGTMELGPIGGNVETVEYGMVSEDQAQSRQLETYPRHRSFVACGYSRLQSSIVVHNLSI